MRILSLLVRASLALVALVAMLVVGVWLYLPPMCGNDLIEAIPSPDGSKNVVVFQRDCGATTGFSTQASLLSSGEALSNKSGNIFTSDTNHGAAPSGRGGGPDLRVAWRSANTVAISYHPAVRVFKAEQDVAGVEFSYSLIENAAQQGAPADRADLFARKSDTAACTPQGCSRSLCVKVALHYLDGRNGVKDLDVWSFYPEHPKRMFPPRRRAKVDFGDPKFGVTPDTPGFVGRRVDLIGRSIASADPSDPVGSLRRYLTGKKTDSARLLAEKAVVLIEPRRLLGTVVWPPQ